MWIRNDNALVDVTGGGPICVVENDIHLWYMTVQLPDGSLHTLANNLSKQEAYRLLDKITSAITNGLNVVRIP